MLRDFRIAKGGTTACHGHDFPNLVKIEAGQGVVVDTDKTESPLRGAITSTSAPGNSTVSAMPAMTCSSSSASCPFGANRLRPVARPQSSRLKGAPIGSHLLQETAIRASSILALPAARPEPATAFRNRKRAFG